MTPSKTPFSGQEVLAPGDPLSADGYYFQARNPLIVDRLLRIGATTHRHDEHVAMTDPTAAPIVAVDPTSGAIPSDTPIFVTYTLLDADGGETLPTGVVQVTTPTGYLAPTGAPDVEADYALGALLAGDFSYAVTITDGRGGESMIGPASVVTIEPGHATARVMLSGLAAIVSEASGHSLDAGWRLWRSQGGGPWYLLASDVSDTFTDDGVIGDCTIAPPLIGTTVGTNALQITVPDESVTGTTLFSVYASIDGTFTGACRLGTYAASELSVIKVYTELAFLDGAPPVVSTSYPGAHKLFPDTELMWGLKSPVATVDDLPAGVRGDVRVVLDGPHFYAVLGAVAEVAADWTNMTWLLPTVPTAAELPVGRFGDARVTLDTRHLWLVLGPTATTVDDWTDVAGGAGNVPISGPPDPGTGWWETDKRSFDTEPDLSDWENLGGPTLAVVDGKLTTSDQTQTQAVNPGIQGLQRPHSKATHFDHMLTLNDGTYDPDSPMAYQNGVPWGHNVAGEQLYRPSHDGGVSGATWHEAWVAAGWDPPGWDWEANDDMPPPIAPAPTWVQQVWEDDPSVPGVYVNKIGDTLTVQKTGAVVPDWHHANMFWWDGVHWAPLWVSVEDGTGYSASGVPGSLIDIAHTIHRPPPITTQAYIYRWTGPGDLGDNTRVRMHVKDFDKMTLLTDGLGGTSNNYENYENAAIGIVLSMTGPDDGLVLYARGATVGWAEKPSDLIFCEEHFPSDDKAWLWSGPGTGETLTLAPGLTYTANPDYDPLTDGQALAMTAGADFWLELSRQGDLATARLYFKDPDDGARSPFTATYDLTGTPWAGGAGAAPVGIATPYLMNGAGPYLLGAAEGIPAGVARVGVEHYGPIPVHYKLKLTDVGECVEIASENSTSTAIVPADVFDVGAVVEVRKASTGNVTLVGEPGVTLHTLGTNPIVTQYATLRLHQRALNEWVVTNA